MKVLYNIKKVELYPISSIDENGTPTYGTCHKLPGSISLSLDQEGDSTIFYADGVSYVTLGGATTYSGSFENAMITREVLTSIFAYMEDANKNLVETDGACTDFGMKFACDSDEDEVRFTLYRVSSTKPNINLQTKESSPTINGQSVNLTVSTVTTAEGKNILKSFAVKGDTNYDSYFGKAPTMPTFTE